MINLAQRGSRSAAEVVIAILLGPAVKPPNAWVLRTMRPGEAPLEALTAAIIRLWQLDARDPDQAALPRKWAKGLAAGDNTLADLTRMANDNARMRKWFGRDANKPICR
jgi:hypothetical protein